MEETAVGAQDGRKKASDVGGLWVVSAVDEGAGPEKRNHAQLPQSEICKGAFLQDMRRLAQLQRRLWRNVGAARIEEAMGMDAEEGGDGQQVCGIGSWPGG